MKLVLICLLSLLSSLSLAQPWNGVYTVGVLGGEDFSSLTTATGAFAALSRGGVTGDVELRITSDLLSEDGAVSLKNWGSNYRVKIVPNDANQKVIRKNTLVSSCNSLSPLIQLDSVENFQIEGRFNSSGNDRLLVFESACSFSPLLLVKNSSKSIRINNSVFRSENSSKSALNCGAVHLSADQETIGHEDFEFYNNLIEDLSGNSTLSIGFFCSDPDVASTVTTGLEIVGNLFKNFSVKGIIIKDSLGSTDEAFIKSNHFYADVNIIGPDFIDSAYSAIHLGGGSGHRVFGNYIGGNQPFCQGNKLQLSMADSSRLAYLIFIPSWAEVDKFNLIDSNVISNITVNGSYEVGLNVGLIKLNSGNNKVGVDHPNFIGDTSVAVTNEPTSYISVLENSVIEDNFFRVIDCNTSGKSFIYNNVIGGVYLDGDNGNRKLHSTFIFGRSSNDSTFFVNNKIGGIPNNILIRCDTQFRVIMHFGIDGVSLIQNNVIKGITTAGNFSSDFLAIRSYNCQNSSISNNVVGGDRINAMTNPSISINCDGDNINFRPIEVTSTSSSGKSIEVADNIIGGFSIGSSSPSIKVDFKGVYLSGSFGGGVLIDGNIIGSSQVGTGSILTATRCEIEGISVFNPNDEVVLSNNHIRSFRFLSNSETQDANFSGIKVEGVNSTFNLENNHIGDNSVSAITNPEIDIATNQWLSSSFNSGISVNSALKVYIFKNFIGGFRLTSPNNRNYRLRLISIENVSDTAIVSENLIGGVDSNILVETRQPSTSTHRDFVISIYAQGQSAQSYFNISSNLIRGLNYIKAWDEEISLIFASSSTSNNSNFVLSNNIIENSTFGYAGADGGLVYGINSEVQPGDSVTISENQIRQIELRMERNRERFVGIKAGSSANYLINQNQVKDLTFYGTRNNRDAIFQGIVVDGINSNGWIESNLISDIEIQNNGTGNYNEIHAIITDGQYCLASNNVVLLNKQSAFDEQLLIGIEDNQSNFSGNLLAYNNTIDIRGNSGASSLSSCIRRNSNIGTLHIKNNFLNNKKQQGANYTLHFNGLSNLESNHNFHYVEDRLETIYNSALVMSFSDWQVIYEKDTNSYQPSISQNLIDSLNGIPLTNGGSDRGDNSIAPMQDFIGTSRPINGIVDIGAYEVEVEIVVLPVTLISFFSINHPFGVELKWKTTSEINNDYFTLEHTIDGVVFEELVKINGAGNSNNLNTYSYNHMLVDKSIVNYYRLKQTDFDGTFTYSDVIAFNPSKSVNMKLELFPNPTSRYLTIISKNDKGIVPLKLYGVDGIVVISWANEPDSFHKEITLDLGNLKNGVYILKYKNANNENKAYRILKN